MAAVESQVHMSDETRKEMSEIGDTPDVDGAQASIFTLEILPIIRDAQGQHGLRHGDYQRYRQYCQRRLRRLYKTMRFQHGSRHAFKPKKVTEDLLKDIKYLHIPLMDAERAWSHAMELKLLANTELRKKFHYIRRLRKAASHAGELEKLCYTEVCDARTKLEAQAYASYMKGSVSFELQNWKEAFELFGQARTIYEKLGGAFSEEQRNMYMQRVEEITPNIRYCAYNLDESSTDISDLMQLRWSSMGGAHDPVLTAKIDEVISQTRDKEAAAMTEASWRGHTVPVKNEKVRSFILHAQQSARELDRADTVDSKLTLYDSLLMECKDALQAIKDEVKGDAGSGKTRSQKTEAQIANMQFLHTYITYIKLSKTVERNVLMAESMKSSLPPALQNSVEETPTAANQGKKTSKPEDLVRIYDIILQNLSDMAELPGIDEDLALSKEIAAQALEYKAYRCLFVAHSYLLAKKWREAASLYNRVLGHASSSIAHFQEMDSLQAQQAISKLQKLSSQTRGFKCSAHASCILEGEVVADEMADMSLNDKPLSARLDLYLNDATLTSKKPQVTSFPPDFQPVPCKPLFFDLALNQVEFPSLADRVEVKKAGGLAGYFKGWLWGSGS